MIAYVILAIIFCVVVLSGASVMVFHLPPSLGRKMLPPKTPTLPSHAEVLREIDQLERELKLGKYEKSQAEFDAEVEEALHPSPPKPPPPPVAGSTIPMFRDYEEYRAWMQARYPNWNG